MMHKRLATLIWNPQAGRRGADRAGEVARFCRHLAEHGMEVASVRTSARGDATRLARRAIKDGIKNLIVSGGDGTINEALQAIVGAESVRLGVWARGTANVLARELHLPYAARCAADVILRGETRSICVGCGITEATGARRYFFLMAGIGLDASIVCNVSPRVKRRVGEAAFWYAGFARLARWKPTRFTIEVDGARFPATFAAVGKASRYGGGLRITPEARLAEADFQLCIVDSRSRIRYLHLLAKALRGSIGESTSQARLLRATRVRATGDALVQLDGEPAGALPMTFEVAPQPITIFAPA